MGRRRGGLNVAIGLLVLAGACGDSPSAPDSGGTPLVKVLMITSTAGFRHDSIATARQVMTNLAATSGDFSVTTTEDLSAISADGLASYDVVFFALTSGELPLSDVQKAALLDFVRNGGGFMGAHSATDTFYGWPEYGNLVGAYFKAHPWTRDGTVRVEDRTHPATERLGSSFAIFEEFYTFQENPRPRVQVLLSLDPASVEATGDFPLAWTHAYGQGKVYYNALGHFATTWNAPAFQQQLVGAVRWTGE